MTRSSISEKDAPLVEDITDSFEIDLDIKAIRPFRRLLPFRRRLKEDKHLALGDHGDALIYENASTVERYPAETVIYDAELFAEDSPYQAADIRVPKIPFGRGFVSALGGAGSY
jgi:hypothetical protein